MLPAPKTDRISLADVLPSCLSALTGRPNRLGLGSVGRAVVVLIDGLGADALRARAGHARTMITALSSGDVIDSGFPTTTASALATLATGVPPGQHGMVGYTAYDPLADRVIKQLSGWDQLADPDAWQLAETVFESALAAGLRTAAVGPERYRESEFTGAVLRGAEYVAASSIVERFTAAAEWMHQPGPPALLYLYVPELDMASHTSGWESTEWTEQLEAVDGALRDFLAVLAPTDGILVTADHGVLDIPERSHILIDSDPALTADVRFVAGDPRCLQLHLEPNLAAAERDAVLRRWRASESGRAWVVSREEAIAGNWFGAVRKEVAPRIGDILVAARKNIAYYDTRIATKQGLAMVGQHGSWSPAEVRVPMLRFGAFART